MSEPIHEFMNTATLKYKQIKSFRSLIYYLHKGKVIVVNSEYVISYFLDNEKNIWYIGKPIVHDERVRSFRSLFSTIQQLWIGMSNLGVTFEVMI